jgi:threonine aldolase
MQLPSKTRFLAAQFHAYLKNDLWRDIANRATNFAADLANRLQAYEEIKLIHPVQSNALFIQLPREWIGPLREKFFFDIWDVNTNLCRWMVSFDWSQARTEEILKCIDEVKLCFPKK